MRTFFVTSTIISKVNLPCENLGKAIEYLNGPNRPDLLSNAIELVSDDWDIDDVEMERKSN